MNTNVEHITDGSMIQTVSDPPSSSPEIQQLSSRIEALEQRFDDLLRRTNQLEAEKELLEAPLQSK
jgi:prefoldin subunit 5